MKTILVTGSAGMIGSHLVATLLANGYDVVGIDKNNVVFGDNYKHVQIDLSDVDPIEKIFKEKNIYRVIHLAALAHNPDKKKYSKEIYKKLNVDCANNVFKLCSKYCVPVLFASTVDVFGFQKGTINSFSVCKPVTIYGKTKYEAEKLLEDSGVSFTIFRLSPIYSSEIKRDIQKRIYLKYPNWAYKIGKNTQCEVLHINKAVTEMVHWCSIIPKNNIVIVKDSDLLNTCDFINDEKKHGRAKHILRIPRWLACLGYGITRISGKNRYTFLLKKAIYPYKSE